MHIGIDATALYGRYGGVEYALWNLLDALKTVDRANFYTVYIPADGPPPERLKSFNRRWRWHRLSFCGGDKARRVWWQQVILPRQVKRDHCHLLHAPTYIAPLACPIPLVLTIYDFIALSHPDFATPLNRVHYGALLPRSAARASRVIVPSEAVRDELTRRVPSAANRARVVPLGVEPLFHQTPDARTCENLRAQLRLPSRYLLFVGNPEPKKNLAMLQRARELLPREPLFDLPLVVTGGARAWADYEIATQSTLHRTTQSTLSTTNAEAQTRTISVGYVRRADLPALYAMCEAFIFPSLIEGFGLPVLEALACGAPVVTTDRVPLPNLFEAALQCDPLDPKSIATTIERVLRDDNLRADLRRRARDYARSFTWRRSAQMTLDVYQSLVR